MTAIKIAGSQTEGELIDVQSVLSKLTIPEKISLLSGSDFWHTAKVERLGIPAVRMSDGPNGVRGQRFFNGTPSSCFPSSTGLGSSWDVDLAKEIGIALGEECKEKGTHVLLAPTVNTQRSPLGGRGFESFSEDPVLNGEIAAAYINGVQENGVQATIKHFVCNDQELERMSIDAIVSERALREVYLKPFQIAIKKSNPHALMTAYNRLGGVHVSEDPRTLDEILRKEWKYEGTLMSDWTGTYSTVASIKAGLDIEMPGPSVVRGAAVSRALTSTKLTMADLDARVVKVLEMVRRAQQSNIPFDAEEKSVDSPALQDLLRRSAADAIVLLKNSSSLLPLSSTSLGKPLKKLAVIGSNAKAAFTSGGGSAQLNPSYTVTPLQGITAAAKEIGTEDVSYAVGAPTHRFLPLIEPVMSLSNGRRGALVEFYNEPFGADGAQKDDPIFQTSTQQSHLMFFDNIPSTVAMTCWNRYSGTFTPDVGGTWEFGIVIAGQGNLYIEGKLIIDNTNNQELGELFFGQGSVEVRGTFDVVAGKEYHLEVRSTNEKPVGSATPFAARGAIRIGAWKLVDEEEGVKEAVELAKGSDAVILVVGLNYDWESEGYDRKNLLLPGLANKLVSSVLAVNPNVVVVSQSGMPVEMPWINEASTVVQAFYGGNDLGSGLADVLFGKRDPSGKLSVSFPRHLSDNPSFISFPGENGKVIYNEGIYVGYRYPSFATTFPFGHGLTYSSFSYSNLSLPSSVASDGTFTLSFTLTNTGSTFAREIVQVYISDKVSSLPRPEKELKGFKKVALKAGEKTTVKISLDGDALSFYDDKKACWVAEKGVFEVRVAASSEDVRLRGEVELKESFTWVGL